MPSSAIKALLSEKCPRCRQGNIFAYSRWNLARFQVMNKNCPHCGVQFEKEPGTFFAAMFISYAFNVAIFIFTGISVYYLLHNPDTWVYILVAIGLSIVLLPVNFRFSRTIWLYFTFRYEPELNSYEL
jgi:uncharacterized protein (DUF983 family)